MERTFSAVVTFKPRDEGMTFEPFKATVVWVEDSEGGEDQPTTASLLESLQDEYRDTGMEPVAAGAVTLVEPALGM